MKKITLLFLIALVTSCGVRQTRESLSAGDYDTAIQTAVEGLSNRKDAKGKQDYVYMLEEAFAKAKERDLNTIKLYKKENSPANTEKIYNLYLQLNNRQESIKPLLPLKLLKEGRNAYFPFDDYSTEIVESKNNLVNHLYNNSKSLLVTRDKMNFRRAYDDLNYVENLSPNFKDVRELIMSAKFKGTDYVFVSTRNETNMVIPNQLENDLLDFSTYGINDVWTVYHNTKQKGITYNYGVIVNFRQINISPEQIKEKQFIKEKQIKDGTKNATDANGNVIKDAQGNPVQIDNMKTVTINIYEFTQNKSCQVTAKVDYVNFNDNQLLNTFPLSSEFIFSHIYATYNGDKRACDDTYLPNFNQKAVPFPSNEQMVYDCGEDLKAKLKAIITGNKIRR